MGWMATTMAASVVAVAVIVALPWDLPHPYNGLQIVVITAKAAERIPPFPPDLTGPWQTNTALRSATRMFQGRIHGAESVAMAPDGTLVMLDKHGYVHRASLQDDNGDDSLTDGGYRLHAHAPMYIGPGRPLGFHVTNDSIIVCDSLKGLTRVNLATGEVCVLANRVTNDRRSNAKPHSAEINYANDLDVSDGGVVFFSSSTEGTVAVHPDGYYDTMRSFLLNMCRGDPTGRLLRFDPADRSTTEILGRLWYANGVSMTHDGKGVLVVETMQFRVLQHHLSGPLAGTTTTLIDKLPGFPDGVTRSSDGNYWVSLVAPLSPLLKVLQLGSPVLQRVLAHVMTSGIAKRFIKRWGCVVKVSPTGQVLQTLMDPTGEHISSVSAVTEVDGQLFLGNLLGDFVSVINLEDVSN